MRRNVATLFFVTVLHNPTGSYLAAVADKNAPSHVRNVQRRRHVGALVLCFLLFGCTPQYQEIPVACDSVFIGINGGVSCYWNGEEQTYYECPKGIEKWSSANCNFTRCMKERNIGVLLRARSL